MRQGLNERRIYLEAEVVRLKSALDEIRAEASQFYAKWVSRINNHPLLGFACHIELRAIRSLLPEEERKK